MKGGIWPFSEKKYTETNKTVKESDQIRQSIKKLKDERIEEQKKKDAAEEKIKKLTKEIETLNKKIGIFWGVYTGGKTKRRKSSHQKTVKRK